MLLSVTQQIAQPWFSHHLLPVRPSPYVKCASHLFLNTQTAQFFQRVLRREEHMAHLQQELAEMVLARREAQSGYAGRLRPGQLEKMGKACKEAQKDLLICARRLGQLDDEGIVWAVLYHEQRQVRVEAELLDRWRANEQTVASRLLRVRKHLVRSIEHFLQVQAETRSQAVLSALRLAPKNVSLGVLRKRGVVPSGNAFACSGHREGLQEFLT